MPSAVGFTGRAQQGEVADVELAQPCDDEGDAPPGEAAGGEQLAVCEVGKPEDAVDHRGADRGEPVCQSDCRLLPEPGAQLRDWERAPEELRRADRGLEEQQLRHEVEHQVHRDDASDERARTVARKLMAA
jgi:hypothetical protein